MRRTVPARSAEIVELKATRAATARRSSWLEASVAQLGAWFPILVGAVFGLVYELSIVFAGGRIARPLATPYAVPIFDTPFALFAVASAISVSSVTGCGRISGRRAWESRCG